MGNIRLKEIFDNQFLYELCFIQFEYELLCILSNIYIRLTIILLYKKFFRISTGALRFPSIYGNSRFSKQFEITSGKKTINIRTLAAEKRYKCMIFFLAPWSVDRRQQMHKHSVVLPYRTHAGIETNADCVTTFVDCICSCMIYKLVQNISLLFLNHNQRHQKKRYPSI